MGFAMFLPRVLEHRLGASAGHPLGHVLSSCTFLELETLVGSWLLGTEPRVGVDIKLESALESILFVFILSGRSAAW